MTTHHNYPGSFSNIQIPKQHPTETESAGLGWIQDISTLSKQSRWLCKQSILASGEAQLEQHRLGRCQTGMQPHPHALSVPACSSVGVFPERSEDVLPNTLAKSTATKSCPFLPWPSSNQLPIPTHPGRFLYSFPFMRNCLSFTQK